MKLSALKKEILLVLLSESSGGERLVPLSVDMIVNKIKEKGHSSLKSPCGKPLNFVCVQRSLKRLARDGLVNITDSLDNSVSIAESRDLSSDYYYLNSRGKRKAKEIEAEIRNYVYKWWKFVE